MEKEEKKIKENWIVSEVPTQTAPAIVNTVTKEVYPIEQAIALVLNNQEKLMKLLD